MSIFAAAERRALPSLDLLSRTCVIVPTLNAGPYFDRLLPALQHQGIRRSQVFIVDSSSEDDTVARADRYGAQTHKIRRVDFNHGGTRRMAVAKMRDFEILVFLTQDAIPASTDAVERLVAAFADSSVGMAYGRQLPRPEAGAIERHGRLYNYPETKQVRSIEDRTRLGAKTVFCSNSFAAYRREALEAVGSFPQDAFFAEDQIVAGRMLIAGWKLAYQADARVFHSHGYTIKEEFQRYFDVGVFHARNPWILETFGGVHGEGFKFVKSELGYVLKHAPLSAPEAMVRTALKLIAYRIGRRETKLSQDWKRRLSMQPFYWRSHST